MRGPHHVCTLRRMPVRAKPITVTTTPVAVIDASQSMDGAAGSFTNTGATVVYVGGDDMTSGNAATKGLPIAAGAGMDDVRLVYGDVLYAVMLTGTGSLVVLVTGV